MKKNLIIPIIFLLFVPFIVSGEGEEFYIESDYDLENRERLTAQKVDSAGKVLFYVDSDWWEELAENQRDSKLKVMEETAEKFSEESYEEITDSFGDPPDHRVEDKDKITVLIHPMQNSAGGYFNSGDQYSRHQNPRSNERNLLYLSNKVLGYEDMEGFLAHEFMHLVTYNQKEKKRGVREEIWLNEARAEYMPTFLGYDEKIEEGNLVNRAETFFQSPSTSLTEWRGRKNDYGVVRVFTQYLVDHYGEEVLRESLASDKKGIESIEYGLNKQGVEKNFHEVFNNFKIAALKNNCGLGENYCFHHEKLKGKTVRPVRNYIPTAGEGQLKMSYKTGYWAGNWHEITGGEGDLTFQLSLEEEKEVRMPYILCNSEGDCESKRKSDDAGKIELKVDNFGVDRDSLYVMPSIQDKREGFNGLEDDYLLEWSVRIRKEDESPGRLEQLREMRERLEGLRKLLEEKRKEREEDEKKLTCMIEGPLHYGMSDSESVACLQQLLASKPEIYPEGYVTGNFSDLTEQAVIRFQERYAEEILHPLGLEEGTGYVGSKTISKIDKLR